VRGPSRRGLYSPYIYIYVCIRYNYTIYGCVLYALYIIAVYIDGGVLATGAKSASSSASEKHVVVCRPLHSRAIVLLTSVTYSAVLSSTMTYILCTYAAQIRVYTLCAKQVFRIDCFLLLAAVRYHNIICSLLYNIKLCIVHILFFTFIPGTLSDEHPWQDEGKRASSGRLRGPRTNQTVAVFENTYCSIENYTQWLWLI